MINTNNMSYKDHIQLKRLALNVTDPTFISATTSWSSE